MRRGLRPSQLVEDPLLGASGGLPKSKLICGGTKSEQLKFNQPELANYGDVTSKKGDLNSLKRCCLTPLPGTS